MKQGRWWAGLFQFRSCSSVGVSIRPGIQNDFDAIFPLIAKSFVSARSVVEREAVGDDE